MKVFLVTLIAFIVSIVPLISVFAVYYYLENFSDYIGISAHLSYFIVGGIFGAKWKLLKELYSNYWFGVWEIAQDKML